MRSILLPIIACAAIAVAADTATIPELDAPRAQYQKTLTDIRAKRDREAAPINKTYAERLVSLYQKLDGEGDAAAALAVKTEHERVTKGVEPTVLEQRKMTGLLRISRTAYEKERLSAYMPAAQAEDAANRAWAASLTALADRLTKAGQPAKAAIAQAELARLSASAAAPVAPVAVASPPAINPFFQAPPKQPAAKGNRIDAVLADKIKAAVAEKSTVKTAASGKREGGSEAPSDGALLVGIDITEFGWRGKSIKAVRPVFLGREAMFDGKWRGKPSGKVIRIDAREGYAVGGLKTYAHDRIAAIQVVFMKINPQTGKLDTRDDSRYTSKWYGKQLAGEPTELGGDGRMAVGVHGGTGADADTIGLVMLP